MLGGSYKGNLGHSPVANNSLDCWPENVRSLANGPPGHLKNPMRGFFEPGMWISTFRPARPGRFIGALRGSCALFCKGDFARCGGRPRALPFGIPRFFEKNRVKLLICGTWFHASTSVFAVRFCAARRNVCSAYTKEKSSLGNRSCFPGGEGGIRPACGRARSRLWEFREVIH